jgi:hypothetical protein
MLKENPQKRPTIYEVVREVCSMQGKEVPIRDVSLLLYRPKTSSEISRLFYPRFMPVALFRKLVVIRNFPPRRWKHLKWERCSPRLSRKPKLSPKSRRCVEDVRLDRIILSTTRRKQARLPSAVVLPQTPLLLWTAVATSRETPSRSFRIASRRLMSSRF